MRKSLCLFISVILAFCMVTLAGCGKDGDSKDGAATDGKTGSGADAAVSGSGDEDAGEGSEAAATVQEVPFSPINEDFEDGKADGFVKMLESNGPFEFTVVDADGKKAYHVAPEALLARTEIGGASWEDYSVETMFKVDKWGNPDWNTVFVILRNKGDIDYYLMGYEAQHWMIKKLTRGKQVVIVSQPASDFQLGQWFTIKGVAQGDTLTLFVNGQQLLTAKDQDHQSGKLGLLTCGADAYFDYFKADAPDK